MRSASLSENILLLQLIIVAIYKGVDLLRSMCF